MRTKPIRTKKMRTKSIRAKKNCYLSVEELESRLVLTLPRPDHVVLVMMENHNYNEIIGVSSAPYINNTLAAQGALMTNSFAIEHPSEPNYLDIFSGSNQGVTDDTFPPPGAPYTTPDLGGELIKAGFTFGGYSEDMPSVGYTGDGPYGYAGKHNPMVDFADVPAADNMPYAGFFPTDFTKLPTFSFVVPNLIDDMHDGTVSQGDTWLKNNVEAYRQWANTHNSLLIVTWDEDSSGNNQIATIFDGQMVKPGQYNEYLDHFGVLRTIEDMYGLPHAGASATATPISDIFVSQSTHLKVAAPSSATAGSSFSITVTAQDANNNTLTSYLGTIHFTSADASAVLPANYTFTAADAGVHTFTGLVLKTAGSQSITATDTVTGSITGNASVTVNPAAAKTLVVSGYPSTTIGAAQSFTVTARDAYGNTATGYTGTVAFSSSDSLASLPANYMFTTTNAGVHTFSATLNTTGTQSITATDAVNALITGSQTGITVSAVATGATYYVSLTGSDNNLGTLSQPFATINHGVSVLKPGDTLYIRGGTYAESLNNTIPSGTSWSAPITVASYSGETAIIKPTSPPSDAIIYFDFQSYVILKNLVVDGSGLGVAGIDGVKITYQTQVPLYANHIRFQGCEIRNAPENGILITTDPSSTEHVYYNEFLGCLIHNNGYNTGNGFSGHGIYSQASFGIIDGNKIYDNAGYGIHLYNSDTGGTADDSNNIVRNNLVYDNSQKNDGSTQSGNAGIGLFDGANNLCYNNIVYGNSVGIVTGFGDSGTLIYNNTITGNGLHGGSSGIFIGGTSSNSSNDIVRNNISYANNGASDYVDMGVTTTADHNLFGVNPLFVNPTANNFHLQAGSPAIDAGITLSQVPVDFDGLKRPQGPAYCIGAYEFPVNSGLTTHLQIVASSSSTAGSSFSVTVTAQDANNNTVPGYTGTVHWTSSDAAATLPSNYRFTAADAGVHTFTGVILKTAGSQSITTTDTVTGSVTGNASVTVNPAVAKSLVVSGYPASSTAGTSHNFTITAQDTFGNTASGYGGTVTFTSSDGLAVLPANYTFTSGDAGVHTFSATLKTAGSQSITATDTVTNSIQGSQTGITVNLATASKLVVSGYPSSTTAGISHSFTITAQDAFGNTVSGYTGTVVFTSSDGQAVLPANYKFTSTDAGVHSFSGTLRTAGSQSITATDTVTSSIKGSQSGITVSPAAISGLRVTAPGSVTAGQAFTITVAAVDPFSNVITGYLGTIHFTSSDNQAVLPSNYTFKVADGGVHVFTSGLTLKTVGAQTVTATDTITSALTGQAAITVNSGTLTPALFGRVSSNGQVWGAVSNGATGFSNSLWASMSTGVTWVDVLMGDFNGDGKTDIVARAAESGDVWVGLSNGSTFQFSRWTTWSASVPWVDVRVGDFNGDGKADLAGRVASTGQWWVAQSTGSSFSNRLWTTWSTGTPWMGVSVGDFNGDGKDDIAGLAVANGQWWLAQSNGSAFSNALWASWSTGVTWVDIQVGDFNGDGKADLTGRALQTGQWWTALSTGSSFSTHLWATWSTGVTWVDVKVGDFNGDGKTDIIGRAASLGQWWLAQSSGSSFTSALWATWSTAVTWVDVQVGDFNGDGKADITGRALEIGQWWTGLSTGTRFNTTLWTTWSTGVSWADVRLGKNL